MLQETELGCQEPSLKQRSWQTQAYLRARAVLIEPIFEKTVSGWVWGRWEEWEEEMGICGWYVK